MNNKLRQTIINLLDDENGVNETGYRGIQEICGNNQWDDITSKVESTEGRFYLNEDDAIDLRLIVLDQPCESDWRNDVQTAASIDR